MNFKKYSIYLFIPLCLIPIAITAYAINVSFAVGPSMFLAILSLITITIFTLWCNANHQVSKQKKRAKKAETLFKNKEAEYVSLIENMGGVLYRCDTRGHFTWLSKKCLGLTGYTAAELKGKHFTELIVPEWRFKVEEFYFNQNSYRIPETVFRFPIYSKDGYKKWVEQNVVFVYEADRCLGYQAIVKDVTDTKLGEDLLQETNKKLIEEKEQNHFRMQAILDHIPMIVYIKDLSGRFVMVNKGFHNAFGTNDKHVIGKKAEQVHKGTIAFATTDEEVLHSLQAIEMEEIFPTVTGEKNLLVTKFPLFDAGGNLFGIGGVDLDITEMAEAREQLIQARNESRKR